VAIAYRWAENKVNRLPDLAAGLDTALEAGLKQGPQAAIQLGSPLIRQAGTRTAQILSAHHIPASRRT